MSNLAIIPARGGSKGIPRKNVKKIAGKPLISWTIEHALSAKCIDKVIVTTDDPEIAEISLKSGAEVPFLRPAQLAVDSASTEPVMVHALNWLEENQGYIPENVILLQPTSPLRHEKSIDEAFSKFKDEGADSLLSVNLFWHFLWKCESKPRALYDYKNRPRRQDIKEDDVLLKENGSIYITKRNNFLSSINRLTGNISTYIMRDDEGFEIDSDLDWVILESLLSNYKG